MINNISRFPTKKINASNSAVYVPGDDWFFSHHPHITYFAGRFMAIWSNGHQNEDDLGQRIAISESPDGKIWSEARSLVTPEMLGDETVILTAAGFHVYGDTLYAFYGRFNYNHAFYENGATRPAEDSNHLNTDLGYICTRDGVTWSEPMSMGLSIVPNLGPQKTNSGRLIICGNTMFPYTDHPSGVEGYQLTGIYGDYFGENPPVDDSATIRPVTRHNRWDAVAICEGSFFQTDDDVLHMMLRSNTVNLWHSESRDDGATWSEPQITGYTDDKSKSHFGRLPDGRFYGINNSVVRSRRLPLNIHVSEDGEQFSRCYILRDEPYQIKKEGHYKGGFYAYPHSLVKDGYMYVIYSVGKETIEVSKFSLDEL